MLPNDDFTGPIDIDHVDREDVIGDRAKPVERWTNRFGTVDCRVAMENLLEDLSE